MQIRQGASIGEIAASAREAARLFEALGIDYACHGNLRLADACAELHFDPADVERALTRLEPEVRPGGDHLTMPLPDLVRELTNVEFPAIEYRLRRVHSDVNEICAGLRAQDRFTAALREAVAELSLRVEAHLRREASEFLPSLAAGAQAGEGMVARALAELVFEHEAITKSIQAARSALANVARVRPACAPLRAALRDLESELRLHVHLENNVLFPRVLPSFAAATLAARG